MKTSVTNSAFAALLSFSAVLLFCAAASAQNNQEKGVISGRSGATMTLKTQDSGNVIVVLNSETQVEEPEGVFRKKHLNMTALVPGLSVDVKGYVNDHNQLVAGTVTFHGSDLQTAEDIQAGLAPTDQQVAQNQKQIQEQEQQIQQQQQEIKAQQAASAAHAAEIAANEAAIVAANKRFGELGDYNILGEVTVLFGNDQVAIEEQYKPQLLKLAQQAKGITAYIIQVKGYASKVGSAALNERLSTERAENVTDFLEQQAQIPLTNILAPGAMGTSRQVAPDTTVGRPSRKSPRGSQNPPEQRHRGNLIARSAKRLIAATCAAIVWKQSVASWEKFQNPTGRGAACWASAGHDVSSGFAGQKTRATENKRRSAPRRFAGRWDHDFRCESG